MARSKYAALIGVSERMAANDLATLVRQSLLAPTGGRGRRTAYRPRREAG
jgi:Fic family protein